jgi:hypothetical protein
MYICVIKLNACLAASRPSRVQSHGRKLCCENQKKSRENHPLGPAALGRVLPSVVVLVVMGSWGPGELYRRLYSAGVSVVMPSAHIPRPAALQWHQPQGAFESLDENNTNLAVVSRRRYFSMVSVPYSASAWRTN